MNITTSCLIALFSLPASAEETRKLSFESAVDHFELVLRGGTGTVAGKVASLRPLTELLPALTDEVTSACPDDLGRLRPDVTVREGAAARRVYIARGVIAADDACVNVGGEGLFYMPIHRDFLIGAAQDGLDLKGDLDLARDGARLLSLKKQGEGWAATDPKRLVNRDFFERFAQSLAAFTVRARVVPGATADARPRLTVKANGRGYDFYRLPNHSWALKKPGAKWLEISDDWSFWNAFDDQTIDDPYAALIQTAGDVEEPADARAAAFEKLEGAWSPNLRALYHRVVLETPGDDGLKRLALKRLKRKPALETAGVMIEVLAGDAAAPDVKRDAAVILNLQNPRGPKYNPGASAAERAKTIAFWRQWWAKQKP